MTEIKAKPLAKRTTKKKKPDPNRVIKRRKPYKTKPGPPKLFKPNMDEVEKLCRLNCTNAELAAYFGFSPETIDREIRDNKVFRDAVTQGKNYGKLSLRRRQVKLAEEGNPTMLIWLGKVYLKQRENVDVTTHSTTVTMTQAQYKKARKEMLKDDDC